jgi:hypothetical protein
MINNRILLSNVEIFEYCLLDRLTGKPEFFKDRPPGELNGLFFKNEKTFFALYWHENVPTIFYENREYILKKSLDINLLKKENSRAFEILDYGIEITYEKSPYVGFDAWSSEIDVDLFSKIAKSYQTDELYENRPQKDFKFPWTKG